MRILIVSDSHRHKGNLRLAIKSQPSAEVIFFLGNSAADMEDIIDEPFCRNKAVFIVSGNGDFCSTQAESGVVTLENHKIYYTHGHIENVKYGLYPLACAARSHGCDIALYGHTHVADIQYDGGLYLVNPGSAADGSYVFVDLTEQGVFASIVTL